MAFSGSKIDPKSYSYRELAPGTQLPWDHIFVGLIKDFLLREYRRAEAGQVSPDCQFAGCLECGLDCPPRQPPIASRPLSIKQLSWCEGERTAPERIRIRFRFQKGEEARFLSHLEILRSFARAVRRAGIPIAYSQGFHPQPRLRIAWALPVGVCGEAEWGEMELEGRRPLSQIEETLSRHLPLGLDLLEAEEVPKSSPSLELTFSEASYEISLEDKAAVELGLHNPLLFSPASPQAFLREATLMARTQRKGRQILIDLKPLIVEFRLREGQGLPSWQLILRLRREGGIHPSRLMARFFSNYLDENEANELVLGLKITRKSLS
jgi:radical SAM-linked protein